MTYGSDPVVKQAYETDGIITAFETSFEFDLSTDLGVFFIDANGRVFYEELNTTYTVSGGGGAVGTVTMTTAPDDGGVLLVVRRGPAESTRYDFLDSTDPDDTVYQAAVDRIDSGAIYHSDATAYTWLSGILFDTDTIDITSTPTSITFDARYQMSITADSGGLKLSGDAASPGNSKYYGTNASGTKGFFDVPISGTYTPTLTNVANLDASTVYDAQFMRVGSVVTVSGKVDVDPTLAVTLTQLGISLPFASALTAEEQCAGTAFASGIAGQGAAIRADATNDRAEMAWISGDVTNQPMYYTFTYQVI